MRRDAEKDLALITRREHPTESTCEACSGTGMHAPGHGLDPDWCHECGGSGAACENIEAQIDEALPHWIERAVAAETALHQKELTVLSLRVALEHALQYIPADSPDRKPCQNAYDDSEPEGDLLPCEHLR